MGHCLEMGLNLCTNGCLMLADKRIGGWGKNLNNSADRHAKLSMDIIPYNRNIKVKSISKIL